MSQKKKKSFADNLPKREMGVTQNLAMLLEELAYICKTKIQPEEVEAQHVTADSREAQKGSLFIALKGLQCDGHDFLDQAIENGCTSVIVERGRSISSQGDHICIVEVGDTRKVYAEVVSTFFGHPAREMNFVGITGTNGKTTVTYLLETIFKKLSFSVGIIGTVNYRYTDKAGNEKVFPAPFTTPEPLILQRLLREMADAGVQYVLMEVSSHALAQERLGDVSYDVAVFTNLSHDHLDYHTNMEEYFLAKSRLFTHHLKEDGSAVIVYAEKGKYEESAWPDKMFAVCKQQSISYIKTVGPKGKDIALINMNAKVNGTSFALKVAGGNVPVASSLTGKFNVENCMTAFAVALELGFDVADIQSGLEAAKGAPGRVQYMPSYEKKSWPSVYVDYAHTPDALRKVLGALKELPHRDLICVFGCGGDRDKEKREVMGRIAAEFCDLVVITDDNPRSESSASILEQVALGVKRGGLQRQKHSWQKQRKAGERGYVLYANREEAIAFGIEMSFPGDIIIVAGKGHEKYQITNEGKRFFDDSLVVQDTLTSWIPQSLLTALELPAIEDVGRSRLRNVSTDTRSLEKGDIFVALKGENFDGHTFIERAVAAGAGALVIDKKHTIEKALNISVLRVDDTLVALGRLAQYRRGLFQSLTQPVVVGITGSSGKTTVKEMVAAIFSEAWPDEPGVPSGRVLKTVGNYNNLIGLPLSLLPLSAKHRAVVLEMGMNAPGEIARLAEIARPDINCIINVHPAHLEGLHSIDGVAMAKEELFAGAKKESLLVVNLDDERVRKCAEKYSQKKISFTASEEGLVYTPEVWASDISYSSSACVQFALHIAGNTQEIELSVPGEHNVSNSLAAAAIAHGAGISLETISAGLGKFQTADKRMNVVQSPRGFWIINDTYNANPASMAAGLSTLEQLTSGSRIAILGDMLELGLSSCTAHHEIGRIAVEKGVTWLAVFGEYGTNIACGAVEAGMDSSAIKICNEKSEVMTWLTSLFEEQRIKKGDWLLVKASRGMRFETIVDHLLQSF